MDVAIEVLVNDKAAASPSAGARSLSGRRIVIYGMNYAPEFAGVGKYTGEIAEHFAHEGADVTVITTPPHYPGWSVVPSYRNRYRRDHDKGVTILRCPLLLRKRMHGIWRLMAPATFALTSAPVALWIILKRRPHTVFMVEPTLFASPVSLLAARLVGAKTVLHVQDLEVDAAFAVGHLSGRRGLRKAGALFEAWCLKRMDRVITISGRMADKLGEKGVAAQKLAVVRNWVDLDHIYPLNGPSPYRAELGYAPDDFVVLYAGNIGAKQGLGVLLDAAQLLAGEPRIKFLVAGEGPARAALMARYGDLPNVRFLSFQPTERLNDFLGLADLHALIQDAGAADLVLPSKLGGMLASGKPILVTAEAETELAVFVKGAATVVAPGNVAAVAEAVMITASERAQNSRKSIAPIQATYLSRHRQIAHLVQIVGETRV